MARLRYWLKMKVWEGTTTWATKCEHIGQVRLYSYILCTFNRTTGEWSNTAERRKAVNQLYDLTDKTQYNYLKGLVKAELLIKQSRGHYKVNPEYVSYGEK